MINLQQNPKSKKKDELSNMAAKGGPTYYVLRNKMIWDKMYKLIVHVRIILVIQIIIRRQTTVNVEWEQMISITDNVSNLIRAE